MCCYTYITELSELGSKWAITPQILSDHLTQLPTGGGQIMIRLIYMANFRSKNSFYKINIEEGQKVHWKSTPLITICIF